MDPLGSIKEVFIVIVLVLMNGLLAMLEMALVSARKSRLEQQSCVYFKACSGTD